MTEYKVKNFSLTNGETLQRVYKDWVESRKHITLTNVSFWSDAKCSYCTITYIENKYIG